ncbi:MAG: TadE family protein [Litoreibacter sp.]
MSMFFRLFNSAKRKLGTEAGNASVEFMISLPVFILLFVSIFELGMAMTRLTMLEHGLDMAMRDIRLGTGEEVTHDDIRDQICEEASILNDCQATLNVEMVTIATDTWTMPGEFASCVDRANDAIPVTAFENGRQNDIMFIRACYVVDPLFPTMGLGAFLETDESGGMHLVASSAFSQEPQ